MVIFDSKDEHQHDFEYDWGNPPAAAAAADDDDDDDDYDDDDLVSFREYC